MDNSRTELHRIAVIKGQLEQGIPNYPNMAVLYKSDIKKLIAVVEAVLDSDIDNEQVIEALQKLEYT